MKMLQRSFIFVFFSIFAASASPSKNEMYDEYFPRLPDLPQAPDSSGEQFMLIATDNGTVDGNLVDEMTLINRDVVGKPLSESDQLSSFEPDDVWRNDNWDDPIEGDLFEGDISGVKLVSKSDFNGQNVSIKNAITETYKKWPNGVIPYTISQVFNSYERGVIYRAIQEFSDKSCISWVPRDPNVHFDFVHMLKDRGCYSRVGRMGGSQVLSLGNGCFDLGTVVHEMLHAVGFWHEQSRPDRDQFVKVNWENILPGMEDNFARYSWAEVSTLSMAYDTSSVMHYSSRAFSRNGRNTLEPVVQSLLPYMGQRNGFTDLDVKKLNTLYACNNVVTIKPVTVVTTTSCNDAYPNGLCYTWSQKDAGCSRYPAFMARYCPKTCGICSLPTITTCQDKDSRCPSWAAYQNQCVTNKQFMTGMCPKTCGICNLNDEEDPMLNLAVKGGAGDKVIAAGTLLLMAIISLML